MDSKFLLLWACSSSEQIITKVPVACEKSYMPEIIVQPSTV